MVTRLSRPKLAGFQCPCCGADLPYKLTRTLILATIDEGKNANEFCTRCRQEFRVQKPEMAAQKRAHQAFALVSVGLILLALVIVGVLIRWVPAFSAVPALIVGCASGLAPLPFVEAWATRHMADLRQIQRRKPALALNDGA